MAVHPVLKRFDIYVYKDGAGGAQVPADATVDFYAQGATANLTVAQTIPSMGSGSIPVWNLGSITGGSVQVGVNPSAILSITNIVVQVPPISPYATLLVQNDGTQPVTVNNLDRLVPLGNRPFVYDDPNGDVPTAFNSRQTEPGTGRVRCYIREYRFDYIITIVGVPTPRLFIDAEGSYVMRT